MVEAKWVAEGAGYPLVGPQVKAGPLRAADTVFVIGRRQRVRADVQGQRAAR